tara:strand:+ start:1709 stop:2413 length:705 start_codon:yes stop_codon:yes gene_type:complete
MIKINNNSWSDLFDNIIIKQKIDYINKELKKELELLDNIVDIFPKPDKILNCFDLCDIEDIKVILVGQDPYINKFDINGVVTPEAMGLSFSVPREINIPPSLKNIYKELKDDLNIENSHGDLTNWNKQGVLLLNRSLTVREGKSNSHKKLWNGFMEKVVEYINENKKNCVFILWGNDAKKLKKLINNDKHLILEGTHPSPLGANKGGFFGGKYFSKTNEYLKIHKKKVINWNLD